MGHTIFPLGVSGLWNLDVGCFAKGVLAGINSSHTDVEGGTTIAAGDNHWFSEMLALGFKDGLAEFVKQCILREMSGTFFPQNAEYSDTVEIVRQFAKEHGHKIWISRIFNPLVWLGAKFLLAIPKIFADSYYVQVMSKYDFEYQFVSFEDSIKGLEIRKTMK